MKSLTVLAVACSCLSSFVLLADDAPKDQTQAAMYFEAILAGEVEKADALIDVPFSFDRKKVLVTKEDVATIHRQILANKGKRAVPRYKIAKIDDAPLLDAAVFPKYTAFLVRIEDDETLVIYVSGGVSPKVIGFSD